jgi:hypothetical protein
MPSVPRLYYTVIEAAHIWGCTPADIANHAMQGSFDILTGIPPTTTDAAPIAGLVAIPASDILPMFRRSGTGPRSMNIHRVKPLDTTEWMLITQPCEGVPIYIDDLLLAADAAQKFAFNVGLKEHDRTGRFGYHLYDWDAFWQAVILRVHEQGVPETLTKFTDEFVRWFMQTKGPEGCPSDSVIRKRLSPIWNRLRQGEPE